MGVGDNDKDDEIMMSWECYMLEMCRLIDDRRRIGSVMPKWIIIMDLEEAGHWVIFTP